MRKSRTDNSVKMYIVSAVLFALIIVWFLVSVGNADEAAREKQCSSVEDEIMNGAVLCYSIEGEYPPSLSYLEENYGITVNSDKYIVGYDYFGANIRPTITVVERE